MGFLQQLQEQLKNIWQNLSNTQKIVLVGGGSMVFVLLIVSTFLLNKTSYEPLYPNLNINDSAMIAAKLGDMGVDYQLGTDGTTILVSGSQKHQLRLDLANELPRGGVVGFESFNETRFGETDTDKRIRYLAALQGELTRTIQEMQEIEVAKVHIVLPEPSLFIRDEKPATASVLLRFRPYANINEHKVRSIMNFLSHSVQGLSAENVTVIDDYGNLLSEGVAKPDTLSNLQLSANQLEITKQFEERLSSSLQSMLERVKGPGKVVVRVSADMDFDHLEISRTEYGDSVLRSDQVREETSEGITGIGQPPGTDTNLPDTPSYQTGGEGNASRESMERIRNFEINEIIEHRKKAPGEITRLSVGVIIDGQLTDYEQELIEEVIISSAGINRDRGDLISITSLPFNTEGYALMQEQLEAALARERRMELIRYGVYGVGALALLVFGYLMLRRVTTNLNRSQKIPLTPNPENNYEDMLQSLSPQDKEKAQLEKRVDKIAKTQPDDTSQVIKTWLAEDTR